jgi:hypothetical protein
MCRPTYCHLREPGCYRHCLTGCKPLRESWQAEMEPARLHVQDDRQSEAENAKTYGQDLRRKLRAVACLPDEVPS